MPSPEEGAPGSDSAGTASGGAQADSAASAPGPRVQAPGTPSVQPPGGAATPPQPVAGLPSGPPLSQPQEFPQGQRLAPPSPFPPPQPQAGPQPYGRVVPPPRPTPPGAGFPPASSGAAEAKQPGSRRWLPRIAAAVVAAAVAAAVGGYVGATWFGTKKSDASASSAAPTVTVTVPGAPGPAPSSGPSGSPTTEASASGGVATPTSQPVKPFGSPSAAAAGYTFSSYSTISVGFAGVRLDTAPPSAGTGTRYDIQYRFTASADPATTSNASNSPELAAGQDASGYTGSLLSWPGTTPPTAADCAGLFQTQYSGSSTATSPASGDIYCLRMSQGSRYASVHVLRLQAQAAVLEVTVWSTAPTPTAT